MKEVELKYGCNPNQKPAKIYMADGSELPVKILSGSPGYINFLDAFNGWQLVSNLKKATGLPAATSFKHVSPAGAAVGLPLTETLAKIYWVNDMDEFANLLWNSLNEDNKVSLFVRYIDIETGKYESKIINKNK